MLWQGSRLEGEVLLAAAAEAERGAVLVVERVRLQKEYEIKLINLNEVAVLEGKILQ